MDQCSWTVTEPTVAWTTLDHEATVFTVSNGYFGTRGTHPESDAGEPGTCLAGIYTDDRLGFRTLVVASDWLGIELWANGQRWDPTAARDYQRRYDLRAAVCARSATVTDPGGAAPCLHVESSYFAHAVQRRLGVQRYAVTAGAAAVEVKLVARVRALAPTRREPLVTGFGGQSDGAAALLTSQTARGEYHLAQAARLSRSGGDPPPANVADGVATWELTATLAPGESLELCKYVAFATSRDVDGDPAAVAEQVVAAAQTRGYAALLDEHAAAWQALWDESAIELDGDPALAQALRYTQLQLLAHAPKDDERVSLAAKPLSAGGYRGHVFWDTDLFMTPALLASQPDLAAHLTNYRYHTLNGARANAEKWGYRGAWYPWESAEDGSEVTPQYWLHVDGREMPITCWKFEIHSVLAVAYATWEHYLATGDRAWLAARGVDVLVETARYWSTRAHYVDQQQRYEIHDVCGPDECHERVNNSAYINTLAAWNIAHALRALDVLEPPAREAAAARLNLTPAELEQFRAVEQQLYIPQDPTTGWYRQFDGFEQLLFVDPHTAQDRFEEPPEAEQTQIVKQADVIMLLYLLRSTHARHAMLANWDYYLPRTEHNSSLSAGTHAAVAARLGFLRPALRFFREAAAMDLRNVRGDSGRGLHGACLGGAICAAVYGFGGVAFHEDRVSVDPILPAGWERLKLPLRYQGRRLTLDVTPAGFTLTLHAPGQPLTVENAGTRHELTSAAPLEGTLLPAFTLKRV